MNVIELIGVNIQTYGHFETFIIPDENGKGIVSERDITLSKFLVLINEYYSSQRINKDYFRDIKDCEDVKRFLIKRINSQSESVGERWLQEHTFKEQESN